QQKSLDDLARNKSFTEIFYPPGDVLHSYIFDFKTRGLNNAELKTKFYFIGVANTNDQKIGISAQMDLNKMMASLRTITDQLGIGFLPTIISGFDFTKQNVENIIDTFKASPGDIVMFYYTGHGFRYPNDKSDFPRVSMRLNPLQKIDDNNLVIEDVYDRLLKKGARFTLVLSDCCNETIDAPIPFGLALFRSRSIGPAPRLNVDNWKALFFPPRPSSILIGSAQKNQLAVCNKELGGFYTNYFIAELKKQLFTNNPGLPNWWGILNAARENTRFKSLSALCGKNPERRCVQSAAMKVFVAR
ncbi:MAG TPA: caspase family protein, partial [Segetibacter sp.]